MSVRARSIAIVGGAGLALALVQGVPAGGASGPYINYLSNQFGQNVFAAQPDGSTPQTLLPAGVTALNYDVSADGSALLTWSTLGSLSQMQHSDASFAVVMTRGSESRIIDAYPWLYSSLSADGMNAYLYTVSGGSENLYKYSWASDSTTKLTVNGSFPPPADPTPGGGNLPLNFESPSPDEKYFGGVWGYGNQSGGIQASVARVFTFADPVHPVWTSASAQGSLPVRIDEFKWVTAKSFLVSVCLTSLCTTWTTHLVDLDPAATPGVPSDTILSGLPSAYDIESLNGTWFAWRDTGTGTSTVSSYTELSDLTATPTTWTPRVNGSTTFLYRPSLVVPVTQTDPNERMPVHLSFEMSSRLVLAGSAVVYRTLVDYGSPRLVSDIRPSNYRGLFQSSTDGGHVFHTVTTTSGAKSVTWPGNSKLVGNGTTPKLKQNTWFRWYYPGDTFTSVAKSATILVRVAPKVVVTARKSGANRILSGTASRVGGTMTLFKGSKLIARTAITSAGAYKFNALKLPAGTYLLVTSTDAKWASTHFTFRL